MVHKSTRLSVMLATFVAATRVVASQLPAQSPAETTEPPVEVPEEPTDVTAATQNPQITAAVDRFRQRDFDGALKLLEQAVKEDNDLPPAQVIMAQLFGQARQTAAVRRALESAIMETPTDPEAYIILADFALRDGRITEAGLLYDKANDLLGKFTGSKKRQDLMEPRVLSGLAAVAEARKNWPEAQKQIEAWLKTDENSAQAMQRLARALFKQKDAVKSYEMLKKAKEADPETLTPAARLAIFYEQAGDHEKAVTWMTYALKVAPSDLPTHMVAAQWALETGQLDLAKQLASKSTDLDPESLEAMLLLGVVELFLGNYKDAEGYFEQAHLQETGSFAATNNLALALCEQDDNVKKRNALGYAEKNARAYPKSAEAASTLGWVLYKMARLNEAEKALQQAMRGGTFNSDTAYFYARILIDRDKRDDAKKLLEAALKNKQLFSKRREAEKLQQELNPVELK